MSGTSQLWAEIEKPEGSRSNKVARQSNWQTAGSGSRSSHSSCRIPSQRGEAQSYVWFFLFFFCELGWGNFWRSFQSSEVSGLMNPLKPLASKLAGMIGTGQSISAWQPSASLLLPSSTILFKLITYSWEDGIIRPSWSMETWAWHDDSICQQRCWSFRRSAQDSRIRSY